MTENSNSDNTDVIDIKSIEYGDVLSLGQVISLSVGEQVLVMYNRETSKGTHAAVCSGNSMGYDTYELGTNLRTANGCKESEVTSCNEWSVIQVDYDDYSGYTLYLYAVE